MPVAYGSTTKSKIERYLRTTEISPFTIKELQLKLERHGINATISNIRHTLNELEINNWVYLVHDHPKTYQVAERWKIKNT